MARTCAHGCLSRPSEMREKSLMLLPPSSVNETALSLQFGALGVTVCASVTRKTQGASAVGRARRRGGCGGGRGGIGWGRVSGGSKTFTLLCQAGKGANFYTFCHFQTHTQSTFSPAPPALPCVRREELGVLSQCTDLPRRAQHAAQQRRRHHDRRQPARWLRSCARATHGIVRSL